MKTILTIAACSKRSKFALALWAAVFFPAVAAGQDAQIAERIRQCGVCHGDNGNSRIKNTPSLAGQPEFFILNQLFLMREGVRPIEAMKPYVKDLTDSDIQALAKHFAALEALRSNEDIDPALVKRGAELAAGLRCGSCHLPSLAGRQQIPRLARQRIDYLVHSMREFRDNQRSGADTLMSNAVAGLSDADLSALAHYAASVDQ